MPNKICYFHCNKSEKLSVFNIPKDKHLKEKWLQSLGIDHFSPNEVICEKHFRDDLIIRSKDIVDNLGNVIFSVSTNRNCIVYYNRPKRLGPS